MALAFKKSELVYLHCVSKETFGVTLKGFTCVSLICREAHVSYIEKMSKRRRCLVPDVVEDQPVNALFEDQSTTLLVRINSSCDITSLDPNNHEDAGLKSTLMWSFKIIPAPPAQVATPRVAKESPLDEYFPTVKVDAETSCNCTSPSLSCLESLTENVAENIVSVASEDDSPSASKNESPVASGDERPASCDDDIEYFTQIFPVKGSFWEGRYQEALLKCMELKAAEENVEVRTCFEPDNLRDRNAIKFEVLYYAAWHVIGYCSVDKIPKLTKAIRRGEIISFRLKYVKRKWIPKIRAYQRYAAVSITKRDQWDRNDPNNKYNSELKLLSQNYRIQGH